MIIKIDKCELVIINKLIECIHKIIPRLESIDAKLDDIINEIR